MAMREPKLIDLNVTVLDSREKAWLVETEDGQEAWVPKSQAELDDDVLTLPEWLAIEKGLI
jgi:hypothetical protein